jgi:hypothetical protein
MNEQLIRYETKPGHAAANEELVRAVYEELHRTQPEGLQYATLRLGDGVTFVHLVRRPEPGPGPLVTVKAFAEFQAGLAGRCRQQPHAEGFTRVGSYRAFGDDF